MDKDRKKEVLRKINEKAQAAMEFLMTYGWAILVVLVVIGALSYFGVLDPASLLPERCTFQPGFSCMENVIEGGYAGADVPIGLVSVNLLNNLGEDIYITGVEVNGDGMQCLRLQLAECENPGQTSFIVGLGAAAIESGSYNVGGAIKNGFTCLSINEYCTFISEQVFGHTCPTDVSQTIRWKAQAPLKGVSFEDSENAAMPCINIPPGRVNAQVKITYRKAKSSFDHIAYGDISSNVIWV